MFQIPLLAEARLLGNVFTLRMEKFIMQGTEWDGGWLLGWVDFDLGVPPREMSKD